MVGLILALLKGGATAAAGYIGGTIARSAMNIVKGVGDYVYFDKENGFEQDHECLKDMSVGERVGYLFMEGLSSKKEEEGQ